MGGATVDPAIRRRSRNSISNINSQCTNDQVYCHNSGKCHFSLFYLLIYFFSPSPIYLCDTTHKIADFRILLRDPLSLLLLLFQHD